MSRLRPRPKRAGRTLAFFSVVVVSLGACVGYPYGSQKDSYGVLPAGEPRTGTSRPSHAELVSLSTGTYVDRLLSDRDSVIERWPDRVSNPIKVWIEAG